MNRIIRDCLIQSLRIIVIDADPHDLQVIHDVFTNNKIIIDGKIFSYKTSTHVIELLLIDCDDKAYPVGVFEGKTLNFIHD